MENAFTLAVLIVAVVCVMIATRPVRPANRRRQTPRDPSDPPGPPAGIAPPQPDPRRQAADEPVARRRRTGGRLGRWDRRDLTRAVAVELVAPGSEGEVWPDRR